jgi:hypothetical protein
MAGHELIMMKFDCLLNLVVDVKDDVKMQVWYEDVGFTWWLLFERSFRRKFNHITTTKGCIDLPLKQHD